jgi:uncharacterized protein (DUF58 family)
MLFPPDFLTRLEYISLISKRVFRGSLLAQRRTLQLGTGNEFSDHRDYAAGDDLRYLDWHVYARHGDLMLKRFQEEQDLHVYFLLDCSRSMGFGDSAKFDLARRLVAALAYIALADLDRVSVLAYSDRTVSVYPVTRGKARILSLMAYLEGLAVDGRDTDMLRAAQSLLHRSRRRGLAMVVSDLFDGRGFQPGLDQLRYHKYDSHVIQVFHPREAEPQLLGEVEFIDVETGSARQVTVSEKSARTYRRLFAEHQQSVRGYCRSYGLGCTQTPTTVDFDDVLLRMMRASRQTN